MTITIRGVSPSHPVYPATASPAKRRFGKPSVRSSFLHLSKRGMYLVDAGKTSAIVPVAGHGFVTRFKRGHWLDFHYNANPQYWRRVQVSWVCRHAHLADIPACPRGHDPALIDPVHPQWARVLADAESGGDPRSGSAHRARLASNGWLVLDWRPTPGRVTGTVLPPGIPDDLT